MANQNRKTYPPKKCPHCGRVNKAPRVPNPKQCPYCKRYYRKTSSRKRRTMR